MLRDPNNLFQISPSSVNPSTVVVNKKRVKNVSMQDIDRLMDNMARVMID